MKKFLLVISAALAFSLVSLIAASRDVVQAADAEIVTVSPADLKWAPAPMVVPAGAEAAVLEGDPTKDGAAYTLRLKMPDGYRVGPHFHPEDENVTVMSGTLGIGMGDKFDPNAGQLVNAGGFLYMPRQMHHFAWAKGPTIIQIHGIGPFAFTYINPADDRRIQK